MNKWVALSQPIVMDSGGKAECWSRWGMEEGPACQGPATVPRQSRQSGDGKSSAPKSIMCHLRAGPWWRGDAVPESQHVTDLGFQSRWHNFIRKNELNNSTIFFFIFIYTYFPPQFIWEGKRCKWISKIHHYFGSVNELPAANDQAMFSYLGCYKGNFQGNILPVPDTIHPPIPPPPQPCFIGCNAGFLYSLDTYAYFFRAKFLLFQLASKRPPGKSPNSLESTGGWQLWTSITTWKKTKQDKKRKYIYKCKNTVFYVLNWSYRIAFCRCTCLSIN